MKRRLAVALGLTLVVSSGAVVAGPAPEATAVTGSALSIPTVTGPVTGGKGRPSLVGTTTFDLATVGYVADEYLLSGTATAYTSSTPLTADGKWKVEPATAAQYTTRIVVYRPSSPKKFNGTVVVEWLNVTAGFDSAPEWLQAHDELVRGGFAW